MLALAFGFLILAFVDGSHLPTDLQLCHRSDPNILQCLATALGPGLKSFANGNKYYSMPIIEPLFVEEMVLKGVPSDTVSIEQKYKNVYIHGITTSNAERNFQVDLDEKCEWAMEVETPVLRMEADYELTGKLLLFQLNGNGKCNVTMYNMANIHTVTCEKYNVKGKTHIRLTNYTMNMMPENVRFDFENLFPGNEQISVEILKTLNENSMVIFNDIKSGFEEIFSRIHMAIANKLFAKEPMNEIFLD